MPSVKMILFLTSICFDSVAIRPRSRVVRIFVHSRFMILVTQNLTNFNFLPDEFEGKLDL